MYCHQDADEYGTWIQILEGMKFWVFVQPRGQEHFKSRKQIHEAWIHYLSNSPDENGYYEEELERYVVYASR